MSGVRRITAKDFEPAALFSCHAGAGRYPRRRLIPAFAGMTSRVGPASSFRSSSASEKAFEPVDVVGAAAEVSVVDEALMQRDRRFDPADHILGQSPTQA